MIWGEVLPVAGSTLGLGLLAVITYRGTAEVEERELLLPAEVAADQVTALMRHVAATREHMTVRVMARSGRVRLMLAGPRSAMASLGGALGGLLPEARLEQTESSEPLGRKQQVVARVWWSGPWPLLRVERPELAAAATLGVLTSVGRAADLELRVRLWPTGRVNRPAAVSERKNVPANPWFLRWLWPAQPPTEEVRLIRAKYSNLLLTAEVLVISSAGSSALAATNAQRVIAALRGASGIRGVLRYQSIRPVHITRAVGRPHPPLPWQPATMLSPEELTAVAGLPVEAPSIPGLTYGAAPRLIPSLDVPSKGRVYGVSNFPATEGQPLAQPVAGGLQHTAVVGSTGSGKSTLIAALVAADLEKGRGAFILDLKGDLVAEDILTRVPDRRRGDIVVLEPARGGAQPGLQLFPAGGDPELTSDLVLGTLQSIFADSWGVRSSQYFRLGLRTMAATPEATLIDLPALFADARFRRRLLGRVDDPWLHAEWQRFDALSPGEKAAHLSSPLTKLAELVSRQRLRLVLGQSHSKLDFSEVLARRRIVLVSLPPGLLGMPATRLLAALTLWQFFQAVEGRAALAPEERAPFFAYIDEVAAISDMPLPLENILERSRGHGVGLLLAPQALSQLPVDTRKSLEANVGSLVAFAQRSDDEARALARNLPGVSPEQLQRLGRFEVAMRLSLGPGLVTPTMTASTLPPQATFSDPDVIREASAQRWGQTLEEIDAALARRQGLSERTSDEAAGEAGGALFGVTRRQS